jgi:hypothetical protein
MTGAIYRSSQGIAITAGLRNPDANADHHFTAGSPLDDAVQIAHTNGQARGS